MKPVNTEGKGVRIRRRHAQGAQQMTNPPSYPVSGNVYFRDSTGEWVLEITANINGTRCTARHVQPAGTRPEDVVGLPARYEYTPDITKLEEALTELCDEIDNRDIHTAISKTNILWFKRKARAALSDYRKQGGGV